MEEIWKPVVGYEGLYEVSNLGRVKSLITSRILKPGRHNIGYLIVSLTINKKSRMRYVHRLVAEAFIPNPDNLSVINHKDEDKTNNHYLNLEWCTQKYNNHYSKVWEKSSLIKNKKPILQFTKDGEFVAEYPSGYSAYKLTNIHQTSISACCRGKLKSAGDYIWRFK